MSSSKKIKTFISIFRYLELESKGKIQYLLEKSYLIEYYNESFK